MEMTLRERMYNCGDISVSMAVAFGIECIWQNTPDQRKKQRLQRTLMTRYMDSSLVVRILLVEKFTRS